MKLIQEYLLRISPRMKHKLNSLSKIVLFLNRFSILNAQKIFAKKECMTLEKIMKSIYHLAFLVRK